MATTASRKEIFVYFDSSRRACELLIEPYPKEYQGTFIDFHVFDIFKQLQHAGFDRLRYMNDVVFEHLHYRVGKAPFDETYGKCGRFAAGDQAFLALIEFRRKSASCLLLFLHNYSQSKYVSVPSAYKLSPCSLFSAIVSFSRGLINGSWTTFALAYLCCGFGLLTICQNKECCGRLFDSKTKIFKI